MQIQAKKKFKYLIYISVVASVFLFCGANSHVNFKDRSTGFFQKTDYEINSSGETFGPSYKDINKVPPDLVLVENSEGVVGYIRESEIAGASVATPEEAADFTPNDHYINIYLSDGVTIVGKFFVSSGA